jgi:CBS domain-containing protein
MSAETVMLTSILRPAFIGMASSAQVLTGRTVTLRSLDALRGRREQALERLVEPGVAVDVKVVGIHGVDAPVRLLTTTREAATIGGTQLMLGDPAVTELRNLPELDPKTLEAFGEVAQTMVGALGDFFQGFRPDVELTVTAKHSVAGKRLEAFPEGEALYFHCTISIEPFGEGPWVLALPAGLADAPLLPLGSAAALLGRSAADTPEYHAARWMLPLEGALAPEATVEEALAAMDQRRLLDLPVARQGSFLGIISERDLRTARSVFLGTRLEDERDRRTLLIQVGGGLLARELPAVRADETVLAVAPRFRAAGLRALPVTDAEGTVLGILTAERVLEALEKATGGAA